MNEARYDVLVNTALARRRDCHVAFPLAVDGVGVVHAARRGELISAAACAPRRRRSPTIGDCSRSTRRPLHVQQRAGRDAARR